MDRTSKRQIVQSATRYIGAIGEIWGDGNASLVAAAPEMYAALKVVTLDKLTRAYLAANDPKALRQIETALAKAESQ